MAEIWNIVILLIIVGPSLWYVFPGIQQLWKGEDFEMTIFSEKAYFYLFGAAFAFVTFGTQIKDEHGHVVDNGFFLLWLSFALMGGIMIYVKDKEIIRRKMNITIVKADILIIIAELILVAIIPSFIGLFKGLIIIGISIVYMIYIDRLHKQQSLVINTKDTIKEI